MGDDPRTVADLLGRPDRPGRHRRIPAPAPVGRRRLSLLAAGMLAGVALVAVAGARVAPIPAPASVTLTAATVPDGGTYYATASGFTPGETVRWTWTGPTTGFMGEGMADPGGVWRCGPVHEQDPPGDYRIIATGASGRSVSAPLRVTR